MQSEKATNEVEKIKNEKDAIENQNMHTIEVNENLLEDVNLINERIGHIIMPGKLEEENLELKETVAILKCLLEKYENEDYTDDSKSKGDDLITFNEEESIDKSYPCGICPFQSTSKRGLKTHVGRRHKQT